MYLHLKIAESQSRATNRVIWNACAFPPTPAAMSVVDADKESDEKYSTFTVNGDK